jgi:hypothetical protein
VVKRIAILLMLVTSFSSAALTQLKATTDKNPVMVKESFILTVEANDKISTSLLRTDILLKDFVVGNTSASSQTQIVNGQIRHATIWTILLIAKNAGDFTIPAFEIENVRTQPIAIKVIVASKQSSQKPKDAFLETLISKDTVYLQSSIEFTTKLYLALEIQRGSLTEPSMENANIRQIGKDQDSSELKNGTRYRVVKRVYSITPQRSGSYKIKPPVFNGELVSGTKRSFFSGYNNAKPISVVGDELEVNVLPIPTQYAGQWLPSEFVALAEEWQPDSGTYTVGDPITRIITLTAVGVSEEQLPEIQVNYPTSVKTYPDQSTLNSAIRNDRLIAQRKDSTAIVPNEAGQLAFEEVKIPWWNTRTNTMEYATLPARTISVKASQNATTMEPIGTLAPIEKITAPQSELTTQIKQVQVNSLLTWLFLAAWVVTLLLWIIHVRLLKRNSVAISKAKSIESGASGRTYWVKFAAACKANDAQLASTLLVRWGRARWPEKAFTSSLEVALYLNSSQVVEAVKNMQQHLYSNGQSHWQGDELLGLVAKNMNPTVTKQQKELAPLHPA